MVVWIGTVCDWDGWFGSFLNDGYLLDRIGNIGRYLFILSALIGNVGWGAPTGDGYLRWVPRRFV